MGNITQHMPTTFKVRVVKLPAKSRRVQGHLQHHAPIPYGTAPSPLSWRGVDNSKQEVLIIDQLYDPLASTDPQTEKQSVKYGFDPFEPRSDNKRSNNKSCLFGGGKGIASFMLEIAGTIFAICLFPVGFMFMQIEILHSDIGHNVEGIRRIPILVTAFIVYVIGVSFARLGSPLAHVLLLEPVALKDLRSFLALYMEARPVVTFEAGVAKRRRRARGNRHDARREEENSSFAKREWEHDACETIPESALDSIVERVTDHMAQNPFLRLYLNFELELVDDVKGVLISELHQFFVDNRHLKGLPRMKLDWRVGAGTGLAKYVTVTHAGNLPNGLRPFRFVYRLALYLNLWWIFDVSAHFFWPQLYRPEYSKTVYFPKQPRVSGFGRISLVESIFRE